MSPEVRIVRVLDAITLHRAGCLSCVEAGELLGFSERHFRRLRDAFEERGEDGLIDRRVGG
ncbi:MAG: helix-turn-helix domain-containing protein [Acetobacteraceae bacterium]|nr:helix-turn-helix domain-containing protein [Acetobacteraceae bacterium]MSP29796.1 helix-turn-helix domain-containing protein [Acetobacteraceae bacterium]